MALRYSNSTSRSRFFSRHALIRARNSTGSNGLGRWSSAPRWMQATTLATSSSAEIMITGMSRRAGLPFMRSSTASPSRSGIITSSSTRSNFSRASRSSAACPPLAEATL
jgi:hypothetical protein